jgi:hypothetical protein
MLDVLTRSVIADLAVRSSPPDKLLPTSATIQGLEVLHISTPVGSI